MKHATCTNCRRAITFDRLGFGKPHWYHDETGFVNCNVPDRDPAVPLRAKAEP